MGGDGKSGASRLRRALDAPRANATRREMWRTTENVVRDLNETVCPPSPLSLSSIRVSSSQNAELFTLTYGALVRQVLHDCEDRVAEANARLDEMGHAIGCRLIEEFLAKTNTTRCGSFRESAETAALVGFKMFLNLECVLENWNAEETQCDVRFANLDPFTAFVEVPSRYKASSRTSDAAESSDAANDLRYCQLLCGAARGALESVGVRTECTFVKDALVGDPDEGFVMRLTFLENVEDEYPFED